MVEADIFGAEGLVREIAANRCWKAHCDTITNIVSLDEHGCLMTLSGKQNTTTLSRCNTPPPITHPLL